MIVQEIMTREVTSISMDTTLLEVQELFQNRDIHHLPVVNENNRLLGIISDRDMLRTLSPYLSTLSERTQDLTTLQKKAHQFMTRKPITITVDTGIETAAQRMLEKKISCLLIVNPDGILQGIITETDLLKTLLETKPAQHWKLNPNSRQNRKE